jgi:hypothetical protein
MFRRAVQLRRCGVWPLPLRFHKMRKGNLVGGAVGLLMTIVSSAGADPVTVVWDASLDSTVIGYVVSYGTQRGTYSHRVDAGWLNAYELHRLSNEATYYVAVQAYTAAGLLSAFSQELVVPPVVPPVIVSTPPPLTIACPAIPVAVATGGSAKTKLTFSDPVVSGGVPPAAASCTPGSGSFFPLGTTTITCSAIDAVRQVASCVTSALVSSPPPSPANGGGNGATPPVRGK